NPPLHGRSASGTKSGMPIRVIVVILPKPQDLAESHMIGIVEPAEGPRQYFTLEKTISFGDKEDADATMFCGWDVDGTHLNFGGRPKPDVDAFVKRIEEALKGND
ncbi:MAG: hypothetical protein ACI8UO_001311, partial [Verrucomicrobiales bacterium]